MLRLAAAALKVAEMAGPVAQAVAVVRDVAAVATGFAAAERDGVVDQADQDGVEVVGPAGLGVVADVAASVAGYIAAAAAVGDTCQGREVVVGVAAAEDAPAPAAAGLALVAYPSQGWGCSPCPPGRICSWHWVKQAVRVWNGLMVVLIIHSPP